MTTDLDANAPLGDVVSVNTNWTYTPPGSGFLRMDGYWCLITVYTGGHTTSSNTTAYVVACSLNATTTLDILDVQDNTLMGTRLPQSETPSQSWPAWSPGGTPALGNEVGTNVIHPCLRRHAILEDIHGHLECHFLRRFIQQQWVFFGHGCVRPVPRHDCRR